MNYIARLLAPAWILASFTSISAAQTFPVKPIRLVVPFTPGASTDIVGRIMAVKLSESWRQPVIVENRAGAGGTIGTDYVAKAPADGYTLLIGSVATIGTASGLYKNLPYDPLRDFSPVTLAVRAASVLVVHPSLPVRTVKDLIAFAKLHAGALNYSSASNGSPSHLGMELFKTMAGVNILHIPYKGPQEALNEVIAGQIHISLQASVSSLPFVESGRLKAIATSGRERMREFPGVPTISEAALPGYAVYAWFGVLAPAGTPSAIVSKLNKELVRIFNLPEVSSVLLARGGAVATGTADDFTRFIRDEVTKWNRIIKASGAQVD